MASVPVCADEFYMPDAREGDGCPYNGADSFGDHHERLVLFVPSSWKDVAEELAAALRYVNEKHTRPGRIGMLGTQALARFDRLAGKDER